MNGSGQPVVSVIVPCFNYGHLLHECLDSILAQTMSEWECLLIDDGSLDSTREVGESYATRDSRIKYYWQANAGPAAARNLGIKSAKGEFLQFIDADDLLENKKLEIQIAILGKNNVCDIVYSNMSYFSTDKPGLLFNNIQLDKGPDRTWMKKISGSGDKILDTLLRENIMVINSPLIRKTVLDKVGCFDEQLRFNEDWELWIRCAMNNSVFVFDDTLNTKALVRVHENNYSRDRFLMYVYGLKVCLKINKSLKSWKHKKIIYLKIINHQSVLDEKIIACAGSGGDMAIEMANVVYRETGLPRYLKLSRMLTGFSYPISYLYLKSLYLAGLFKRLIIYAS
jgi:glycosyltransferase involved in cell wall biosynthesis